MTEHLSTRRKWGPRLNIVWIPLLTVLVPLLWAAACADPPAAEGRLITPGSVVPLTGDPLADPATVRRAASFEGRVRLLGARPPAVVKPGAAVPVTLYWRIEDPAQLEEVRVFVHAVVPGGQIPAAQADHDLRPPKAVGSFARGDVWEDVVDLRIPAPPPAEDLIVLVGVYEGRHRWQVEEGEHDGENRVEAFRLKLPGGPASFPVATARKTKTPMVIDGNLEEPVWGVTDRLGPFVRYDGKTRVRHPTFARLAWDESHLYVAFEATDPDVHTPYEKRDDPLYNSEAVEIFIDADGDQDEYVELQAAPNDLHFDAAFQGGPRKGFDTSYDVAYETRTVVDGTLNDGSDVDKGFVSEWRIPIAELKDVPAPVGNGTVWKINLFRLDRIRKDGKKVTQSEATAWSSPWSGDFHNLKRFGELHFSE